MLLAWWVQRSELNLLNFINSPEFINLFYWANIHNSKEEKVYAFLQHGSFLKTYHFSAVVNIRDNFSILFQPMGLTYLLAKETFDKFCINKRCCFNFKVAIQRYGDHSPSLLLRILQQGFWKFISVKRPFSYFVINPFKEKL